MKWKIDKNIKLEDYIFIKTKLSKKKFKKMIIQKKVKVNNIIVDSTNFLLKPNDDLELIIYSGDSLAEKKYNYNIFNEIKIIYEDDHLMVIFKPSGILVHENNYEKDLTLTNWEKIIDSKLERSGICHRLDKSTSGLLVIAKTNESLISLQRMFKTNNVIRKYYGIVQNNFKDTDLNKWYQLNVGIGRKNHNDIRLTTNSPKDSKQAITKFRLIENLNNSCSLVEFELLTGRTHQIRVHMNHINHPILNDPLYGNIIKGDNYEQYLFSYYLKFNHPITLIPIELKIDFDEMFKNKLEELRRKHE